MKKLLDYFIEDEKIKKWIRIIYDDVLWLVFIGLLIFNGLRLRKCQSYCEDVYGVRDDPFINSSFLNDSNISEKKKLNNIINHSEVLNNMKNP